MLNKAAGKPATHVPRDVQIARTTNIWSFPKWSLEPTVVKSLTSAQTSVQGNLRATQLKLRHKMTLCCQVKLRMHLPKLHLKAQYLEDQAESRASRNNCQNKQLNVGWEFGLHHGGQEISRQMRLAEQPVLQFKLGAEAVLMEARFPMAGDFMELQFHGAKLVVSSPALKSTPCSLLGTSTKNGVTYQFAEGVQDWQSSVFSCKLFQFQMSFWCKHLGNLWGGLGACLACCAWTRISAETWLHLTTLWHFTIKDVLCCCFVAFVAVLKKFPNNLTV